jgi:protein CpxP
MKKMLVLLAALSLTAGAATAQTAAATRPTRMGQDHMHDNARTPEQHADQRAKRLTQQLGLSADQTAKVREIALAQHQEMQTLRGKYAATDTRKGAGQERKAVREKYDAQLKAALSADQYAKYDQMRDDRMEKRKEKMKDRQMKASSRTTRHTNPETSL